MKKTIFTGAATAIITPMNESGVDYTSLKKLVNWQIRSGIDAIVVAGTTGEASTLTDDEHKEVIYTVIQEVNGRIPVIAGTGSNDTEYALELSKFACGEGADGVLLVTPYYNKATQKGLIKSFSLIADACSKPVILYNVPSRTGCNITPETCFELADHENIVAIKEASGNISQISKLANLIKGKMDIYSGNDDQILPILSLGGKGVISVLSNVVPALTSKMCKLFFEGNIKESINLQIDLMPLINQLFCEVNPIPVKAAMSMMGFCDNYLRLPLTTLEEHNYLKLKDLLIRHGIIEV